MSKPLQNVKQIAAYLAVSPKTLYMWVELGRIPHVKLHGCVRFDVDVIDRWLETCKREANGAK